MMLERKVFAERLRQLRKSRGMLQKTLSHELGISFQALSMMETAERWPSIEILAAIADFFEVSTDYLLGRCDDPDRR